MNNLSIYTKVFLIWYDLCLELLRCILAIQKAHKKPNEPTESNYKSDRPLNIWYT